MDMVVKVGGGGGEEGRERRRVRADPRLALVEGDVRKKRSPRFPSLPFLSSHPSDGQGQARGRNGLRAERRGFVIYEKRERQERKEKDRGYRFFRKREEKTRWEQQYAYRIGVRESRRERCEGRRKRGGKGARSGGLSGGQGGRSATARLLRQLLRPRRLLPLVTLPVGEVGVVVDLYTYTLVSDTLSSLRERRREGEMKRRNAPSSPPPAKLATPPRDACSASASRSRLGTRQGRDQKRGFR
jgi:hypothetical protein